jgi:hypothetical protein
MEPIQFVTLFDRLGCDLPENRYILNTLKKVVKDADELNELLFGLERFDRSIQSSDLRKFVHFSSNDEAIAQEKALILLKESHDLTDSNTLLDLVKHGIRFELRPFIQQVEVTKEQLALVFPLMYRPLCPADDLLHLCVALHQSGRAGVAEAIQQLPDVKAFYSSLPDNEMLLDRDLEMNLKKGHLSEELLGRFLPSWRD